MALSIAAWIAAQDSGDKNSVGPTINLTVSLVGWRWPQYSIVLALFCAEVRSRSHWLGQRAFPPVLFFSLLLSPSFSQRFSTSVSHYISSLSHPLLFSLIHSLSLFLSWVFLSFRCGSHGERNVAFPYDMATTFCDFSVNVDASEPMEGWGPLSISRSNALENNASSTELRKEGNSSGRRAGSKSGSWSARSSKMS